MTRPKFNIISKYNNYCHFEVIFYVKWLVRNKSHLVKILEETKLPVYNISPIHSNKLTGVKNELYRSYVK